MRSAIKTTVTTQAANTFWDFAAGVIHEALVLVGWRWWWCCLQVEMGVVLVRGGGAAWLCGGVRKVVLFVC